MTFDQLKTKLITNENEMFCLFLTMMAVCHTVIPEEDPKNPGGFISSFDQLKTKKHKHNL